MRQRHPRHRCTFDQGLFDDPPLLLDWAVLPLGSGSALAFDCDKFCGLRGSVHLRSKWTRSISVSTKNKDVLLSHLCPDGYQRTLTKLQEFEKKLTDARMLSQTGPSNHKKTP